MNGASAFLPTMKAAKGRIWPKIRGLRCSFGGDVWNARYAAEGQVEQLTEAESDAYYQTRPLGSRLGAWASAQSQIIPNRQVLEDNLAAKANMPSLSRRARPFGEAIV